MGNEKCPFCGIEIHSCDWSIIESPLKNKILHIFQCVKCNNVWIYDNNEGEDDDE